MMPARHTIYHVLHYVCVIFRTGQAIHVACEWFCTCCRKLRLSDVFLCFFLYVDLDEERRMSPSPCLCLCADKKCSFSVGREKKQCSYFFHCYSRVFAASRAALDHFVLGKHTYRNISTGCAVKYFILCVAHFLALSVCVCLMSARLYSHYRLPCCLCHTDCKSSAAER